MGFFLQELTSPIHLQHAMHHSGASCLWIEGFWLSALFCRNSPAIFQSLGSTTQTWLGAGKGEGPRSMQAKQKLQYQFSHKHLWGMRKQHLTFLHYPSVIVLVWAKNFGACCAYLTSACMQPAAVLWGGVSGIKVVLINSSYKAKT